MTVTLPVPTGPIATQTPTWVSLHLDVDDLDRAAVDRLLTDVVAPLADELVTAGEAGQWFFLRYSEGGEHLRLRLQTTATTAGLRQRLVTATGRPVDAVDYVPETERYGGPGAIALAERTFCASTAVAVQALRDIDPRATGSRDRLAVALDLVLATARALGLDTVQAVAWLRMRAYSWRWHYPPELTAQAGRLHASALDAATTRAGAVRRRWAAETEPRWAEVVRRADGELASSLDRARRLGIWASQLHLLVNRIGVGPDEERWLEWMIAGCLESAGDAASSFFDPDVAAADRHYVSASRYVPSRMAEQAPSDTPAPEALFGWCPPADDVALAADPLGDVPLRAALLARRSRRGPYGPLPAARLGTLLWNALRPDGATGPTGRAYPSAGGQLPARLRVIARHVDGLAPAVYEADPERRRLRRVAPCPAVPDLAATSMWFRPGEPSAGDSVDNDRIDPHTVPAVLAVWVDLHAIRARYGMRALRFALLEAGHVAQNLALVAAAADVQLCTLGGVYDDLANELLMLDGVDRFVTYLLPVGGTTESVARTVTPQMPDPAAVTDSVQQGATPDRPTGSRR